MTEAGTVENQAGRARLRWTMWLFTIAAAVLAYLFADLPLARFFEAHYQRTPAWLQSFLDGARHYGQGFSLVLVIALILTLDGVRKREAMSFLVLAIAVTIVTATAKGVAGRTRPYEFLSNGEMWHFFKGFAQSRYGSFPSAHAVSAFAMSALLSAFYRRGRWVFFAAAVLCAVSRVVDIQHYLSDVIIGAALGTWLGNGIFRWKWGNLVAADLARLLPWPRESGPSDVDSAS